MKSFQNLMRQNAGLPLVADDVLEFHGARLLLLLRFCGIRNQVTKEYRIDGLTKMAKLDFFVRYPTFFREAVEQALSKRQRAQRHPESPMIRYQYGPWDQRYFHVLAYLRSKRLLDVRRSGAAVQLVLTDAGHEIVDALAQDDNYTELLDHMKDVAKAFKQKSGNALKNLIYDTFDAEIGELPWGETIQP